MKRIIFASMHTKDDKLAWSGTNYYMYDNLCRIYDVKYVYVHSFLASFLRRLCKTVKLDYFAELLFSYFISKKFEKLMKQYDEEYIVCICASEFFAYSNVDKKIIYISDSTYHLMFDYYMFNVNDRLKRLYDYIERMSLEKAYKIVYSSNWAKNDAINHYGINENKIHIFKFGANIIDKYNTNNREILIKNRVDLLIVGVDFVRKGIDIAIKITEHLNRNDAKHEYRLHIVGIDKSNIIENLGKNDYNYYLGQCIYYGKINKSINNDLEILIRLYKKCNIFILPTIAECAGIVFSESSMYGLPIITRDTGGTTDYVKDGINGFALPYNSDEKQFASKILDIVYNKELYRDLCINARIIYENELNWKNWANRFKDIIK